MKEMENLKFSPDGLITAVIQDQDNGEVLMVAYMNEEALRLTHQTGETHFYSRSRQKLWKKGETSGHTQKVSEICYDCDGDALVVKVEQKVAACHTGHRSCFYRVLGPEGPNRGQGGEKTAAVFDEKAVYQGRETREVLDRLYATMLERKRNPAPDSWTAKLLSGGPEKMGKKLAEEVVELAFAVREGERDQVVKEAADVLYHSWVLMVAAEVKPEEVYAELASRAGKSGLKEKAERKKK